MKGVSSKSDTHVQGKNDGDSWWFRNQHLMKEPRTSGKEENVN